MLGLLRAHRNEYVGFSLADSHVAESDVPRVADDLLKEGWFADIAASPLVKAATGDLDLLTAPGSGCAGRARHGLSPRQGGAPKAQGEGGTMCGSRSHLATSRIEALVVDRAAGNLVDIAGVELWCRVESLAMLTSYLRPSVGLVGVNKDRLASSGAVLRALLGSWLLYVERVVLSTFPSQMMPHPLSSARIPARIELESQIPHPLSSNLNSNPAAPLPPHLPSPPPHPHTPVPLYPRNYGPGVRGYRGTRGTGVRGCEGTGVRGYEGTGIRDSIFEGP